MRVRSLGGTIAGIVLAMCCVAGIASNRGSALRFGSQLRHTIRGTIAATLNWHDVEHTQPLTGKGKVTRVVFTDYECDACASKWSRLALEGTAVRHLPMPQHRQARGAAIAMICAQQQGAQVLMHQALLKPPQGWRFTGDFAVVARGAGVQNISQFRTCLNSEAPIQRLARDSALAGRLGVPGVPTVVRWYGIFAGG